MDRRRFLGGTMVVGSTALIGSAGFLAACSSKDEIEFGGPDLVLLFNPAVLGAGRTERLPFALLAEGSMLLGDGGADVRLQVLRDESVGNGEIVEEQLVAGRVVAHSHPAGDDVHDHDSLIRYFVARSSFPEPGPYRLRIISDGLASETAFTVQAADQIALPAVGDPFPPVHTPTVADRAGVDTLCTRQPACSLHEVDVASAAGDRVALLISTPAFCQTTFCGPVLDVLIDTAPDYPGIVAVHAEVYANPAEVRGDLTDPALRPAPVMEQLGLPFEPALYLIGPDGVVVDRIDNIFDEIELRAALDVLAAA